MTSVLPSCRHLREAKNAYDREHPLHTFSVGIKGAPDLLAAREVAQQLGTLHHEFHFTVEEGIDALYDLIYHIESYEQVWLLACKWPPSCRSCTKGCSS